MNCLLICGLLSDGGLMTCGGFLISHDGGLVISLGALVTCAGFVISLCALVTCGGFVISLGALVTCGGLVISLERLVNYSERLVNCSERFEQVSIDMELDDRL